MSIGGRHAGCLSARARFFSPRAGIPLSAVAATKIGPNNHSEDTMPSSDSIAFIQNLMGFRTLSRNPNRDLLAYVSNCLDDHGVASDIL
jgi:hypothetical protein